MPVAEWTLHAGGHVQQLVQQRTRLVSFEIDAR